ncbi:hypothetical protein LTR94_026172, partial [Friedmanniomyces endolithicus]
MARRRPTRAGRAFVINYEEGGERSVPDGDAASETGLTEGSTASFAGRDLGAESMFEYGSRAGFWRLHRLFQPRLKALRRGQPLQIMPRHAQPPGDQNHAEQQQAQNSADHASQQDARPVRDGRGGYGGGGHRRQGLAPNDAAVRPPDRTGRRASAR